MRNKTVDILGTIYTIEYVDTIETNETNVSIEGICHSDSYKIIIATKFKDGTDIPHKILVKNLYYELLHAIFNEGQYLEYSNDEPFIDWVAKCLYSISKQKVFENVE